MKQEYEINKDNTHLLGRLTQTQEEFDNVSFYLKEHNVTIGIEIYIEEVTTVILNIEGRKYIADSIPEHEDKYHLVGMKLVNHVEKYRNYLIVRDTVEYKQYMTLHEKFKDIF